MGQTTTRLRQPLWGASAAVLLATGLAVAASRASATAASRAAAAGAIPQAGNWEGTGTHGLPMTFSLVHRRGHLNAAAIVVGAPLTCPAQKRDAEAVPLSSVRYSGPGGASAQAGGSAVLTGVVPGRHQVARLLGQFSSPTTGTFSLTVNSAVGCGWPTQTLVWQVTRQHRTVVGDGLWRASLTGPGITSGRVLIRVAGQGRVVRSFRSSYSCRAATVNGSGGFVAAPAYEFIRIDGSFYSPLRGNRLKGHRTLWSGRFAPGHGLTGTLKIFDTCAGHVVRLRFQR